jgi:lipid A ethanolaminephosphotransferase
MNREISQNKLIFLTAIFLVVADNFTFFSDVLVIYPLSIQNVGFLISLFIVFTSVMIILFTALSFRFTTKAILIFSIVSAAIVSYFASSYSIIVDDAMIQNIVETDVSETFDLMSYKLVYSFLIFGALPATVVYKLKVKYALGRKASFRKLSILLFCFAIIAISLTAFSKHYTSFFREHKSLRFQANPAYAFYSVGYYIGQRFFSRDLEFRQIGLDARIAANSGRRKLVIMVVGEAARADHFSLNGYARETNPLLKKEQVINFPQFYSSGTSTAISVPSMFSILDRSHYDRQKIDATENLLDVLNRAGVNILWRDNNSSSKGVARRVPYEDFRSEELNQICDLECRDEGMLNGLQDYIAQQESGDILIVLHQMGNHGPAYYKRYPQSFEMFTPVCRSNQLEQCTREEISNAYDNAILYTDYFLSKNIQFLKQNDQEFETTLVYMSDHGESLGEGGLYLHGLPYLFAPEAQKHVGALMWFGGQERQRLHYRDMEKISEQHFSHDNLFNSLLGLFNVQTSVYSEDKDIFHLARQQQLTKVKI